MNVNMIPEYQIWKAMRARCLRPTSSGFAKYGARGVTICSEWNSFTTFYKDMGKRPTSAHSIDRIESSGNYEPNNCRWALPIEQSRNRSVVRLVEIDGETVQLIEICERHSISVKTVRNRLLNGWGVEAAVKTPVNKAGLRFRPSTKAYKALASMPKSGFAPQTTRADASYRT